MTELSKAELDLAAEHAFGLLFGDELLRARELETSDERFRDEVARWMGRVSPLFDEVEELEPPEHVWSGIAAEIGEEPRVKDPANVVQSAQVIELNRRVRRWRAFAGAMTALAASLAVILVGVRERPAPVQRAESATPMVAMLSAPAEGTKVVASWDPSVDQLVLAVPGTLRSDPNHAHELWIIPRGGKATSLGTMPNSKQMHMRLARTIARLLDEGATIAISVEPRGGSPTGAPTGPVVASGSLTQA